MGIKVSIAILALVVLLQVATGFATRSPSTSSHQQQGGSKPSANLEPTSDLAEATSEAELKEDPDYVPPRSKLPTSSGSGAKPRLPSRKPSSGAASKTTKKPTSQPDLEDLVGDEEADLEQTPAGERFADAKTCKCSCNDNKQRAPSSAASNKWKAQTSASTSDGNKHQDSLIQLDSAAGKAIGDILATAGGNKQSAELDVMLEPAEDESVDNQRQRKTSGSSNKNNQNKNKTERNRNKRDTGKENKKASKKYSKTGGSKSSSKQQKKQKSSKK